MRVTLAIALSAGLVVSGPAPAQSLPKLKSGAWEMTYSHDGADMRGMEDMLAKMPPQVREMMQQKMQQGPTSTTMKHCATPNDESFAQDLQSRMGANIRCENTNIQSSGSTWRWVSKCSGQMMQGQPFRSDAEHVVTLQGSDAFTHKSTTRTEGGPAGTSTRTSTSSGRYLGSDCKAAGALTLDERMKSMTEGIPPGERSRRRERGQ